MRIRLFQVDAFTNRRFHGNPAAVCPLEEWLDDSVLQSIAAENNLPETAFVVAAEGLSQEPEVSEYELRWFTPTCEVELCGHATLASAFVLYEHLGAVTKKLRFAIRTGDVLTVARRGRSLCMDFPAQPCRRAELTDKLLVGLGLRPSEVWRNASHDVAIFDTPTQIRDLRPDFPSLAELAPRATIVTALDDRSQDGDFVSRFFAPAFGIDEDPVTGSAHCTLAPLWGAKLGKTRLHGRQISQRGGDVYCTVRGDRVELSGECASYSTGTINLD